MKAIRCKTTKEKDFCNEFQSDGFISFAVGVDKETDKRREDYYSKKTSGIIEFKEYYEMMCKKWWKAREWVF